MILAPPAGLEPTTIYVRSVVLFQLSYGGNKYRMRRLNTFCSLAPAPAFLIGFALSLYFGPTVCGSFEWEMPLMWLIMAFAHTSPWLMWWQQRTLYKFQTLPDKQQ